MEAWEDGLIEKDKTVNDICSVHWKSDARGMPAKTCCHGCPIMSACHMTIPSTINGINERRAALNDAAKKVTAAQIP